MTKPKRKAVPKNKPEQFTTKEALLYLRKFFNKSTEKESHKLWDILSALRGPDKEFCGHYKDASTAVLRHAFFGGKCKNVSAKATIYSDNETLRDRRNTAEYQHKVGYHFSRHARLAFKALGLDFKNIN